MNKELEKLLELPVIYWSVDDRYETKALLREMDGALKDTEKALKTARWMLIDYENNFPYAQLESDEKNIVAMDKALSRLVALGYGKEGE